MSKLKTNKALSKRFKRTKSGHYKHKQSHLKHILTKKSTKRKRQLRPLKCIDKSHIKMLKNALINI